MQHKSKLFKALEVPQENSYLVVLKYVLNSPSYFNICNEGFWNHKQASKQTSKQAPNIGIKSFRMSYSN